MFEPCETTATITGNVTFGETKEKMTPFMDIPIHVTDAHGEGMNINHRIFLASGNVEGVAGEILDKNLTSIEPKWADGFDIDDLFVRPAEWLGREYPVKVFKRDGSKYFSVEFVGSGGGAAGPPLQTDKQTALAEKMRAARAARLAQNDLGF